MAAQLRHLIVQLLPHHCYEEFFVNYNFVNVNCIKIFISKALGVGIILGSILVKLPQILKLLAAGSSEGISIVGVLLELTAITATVAYSLANSFPFSSWGEGLFLLVQTTIVGALVLYFQGSHGRMAVFLVVYAVALSVLVSGLTPMFVLSCLQALNVPIVVISKMIQALENYRNSSTGQLSSVTIFLMFAGSMARIFTSIQETGDKLVVVTYICASLANGILAGQMLYYWNRHNPEIKQGTDAKKTQ